MGNEKRGTLSRRRNCVRQGAGAVLAIVLYSLCAYSGEIALDLSSEAARAKTVQALNAEAQRGKEEARAAAKAQGLPVSGTTAEGAVFELMKLQDGEPLFYITHNEDAAISTATDVIRNTAPYNLSGSGLIVGAWDDGVTNAAHQEFGSRAAIMDGSAEITTHATLVCGTLGAGGVDARAIGMAPSVLLHSYDWDADFAEMTAAAATVPNQPDKIYVSNHAYGYGTGWEGVYFYGGKTQRQDPDFGVYGTDARDWDALCYSAPYYLPFKSAGNDRDDHAPAEGATFYYLSWGTWQSDIYHAYTCPLDDGAYGGWNTISYHGVAKNAVTVGAVDAAVSGGQRDLAAADMTNFSSWGPVNDGRLKPDLVADGYSLYSCLSWNPSDDDSYGYLSGTSAASANAAGSALLLVEYYRSFFPGQDMRSSMLKGLIIHTADDLGDAGPDFQYGWGLMNTKAAADLIAAHAGSPRAPKLIAGSLDAEHPVYSHVVAVEGDAPLRATLCWTDPPGEALTWTDETVPALVNDLDLRIIGPDGTTLWNPYLPKKDSPAARGDNTRDNVEQVYVATPPTPGLYTLQVSHKGVLEEGVQPFSLLVSGTVSEFLAVEPVAPFLISGEVGGPFSPTEKEYTLTNVGASSLTWTAARTAGLDWLDLSGENGVLESDTCNTVVLTVNPSASELPAGEYSGAVTFTDVTNGVAQARTVTLEIIPGPLPSCIGYCNSVSGPPSDPQCYCDAACLQAGDCCYDALIACPENFDGEGELPVEGEGEGELPAEGEGETPVEGEAEGEMPLVTSFRLDGDAVSTPGPVVTLNNLATNNPVEYMASESSSFTGASWLPYSTAPLLAFTGSAITRRVYFKVRNEMGESGVASDTIYLEPAVVSIAAGTFTMGRTASGDDALYGLTCEDPPHSVTLGAYGLGKYEVTNQQYCDVLNWAKAQGWLYSDTSGTAWYGNGDIYAGGASVPYVIVAFTSVDCNIQYADGVFVPKTRTGLPEATVYSMADHPMVLVSWYGSVAFCNWLSQMLGWTPCYDMNAARWPLMVAPPVPGGYRLPTEAEWERAAAWDGTKHWIYSFLSDTHASNNQCNSCWYTGGSHIRVNPLGLTAYPNTSPVGWFDGVNVSPNGNIPTVDSASPSGAYDMSGNVLEWCNDWYSDTYYSDSPMTNPMGPDTGGDHVRRGGCWYSFFYYCRSAYRDHYAPTFAYRSLGFRISITTSDSEGEIEGEPVNPVHPADLNADWRMVINEAIAYLAGWQQGSNPLGYAIRAAYLWQNGESYQYLPGEEPPLCWTP